MNSRDLFKERYKICITLAMFKNYYTIETLPNISLFKIRNPFNRGN